MPSITLIRPHTHGGVYHPEGSRIDVDPSAAQWLIQHGIARAAPAEAPKPAAKTSDSTTKE